MLGQVDDTTRFANADVKPFVPYLIDEVLRLLSGATDRLRSQELLEATPAAPPPWTVCAPAGSHGKLTVSYDVVTRPGVLLDVALDHPRGCATFTVKFGSDYRPLNQAIRNCVLPWAYLNQIASDAVGSPVDVRSLFESLLPPDVAARVVALDPLVSCADPLAAPSVESAPIGARQRTDGTQPFPFYGVVTVTRGK
jgi:hypothetical protein